MDHGEKQLAASASSPLPGGPGRRVGHLTSPRYHFFICTTRGRQGLTSELVKVEKDKTGRALRTPEGERSQVLSFTYS